MYLLLLEEGGLWKVGAGDWKVGAGDGDGEGDWARRACVPAACAEGEGEREFVPGGMPGLPMVRRTVSRVRSILRKERVSTSCFLDKWNKTSAEYATDCSRIHRTTKRQEGAS